MRILLGQNLFSRCSRHNCQVKGRVVPKTYIFDCLLFGLGFLSMLDGNNIWSLLFSGSRSLKKSLGIQFKLETNLSAPFCSYFCPQPFRQCPTPARIRKRGDSGLRRLYYGWVLELASLHSHGVASVKPFLHVHSHTTHTISLEWSSLL